MRFVYQCGLCLRLEYRSSISRYLSFGRRVGQCTCFTRMIEETKLSNLVIFDLDGVITSEEAYWDTAGLVLHELLYSPRYWNIYKTARAYHPVQTAEESRRISRETLPE